MVEDILPDWNNLYIAFSRRPRENIDLFYLKLFAMAQTIDLKFDVEILPLYVIVIVIKRSGLLPIQTLIQQDASELNGGRTSGQE